MEHFLQFAEEFRDKVNVQLMADWVIEMMLFIHGNLPLQFVSLKYNTLL